MGLVAFATQDANGVPQNVGVNKINIGGIVYNVEGIGIVDPGSGLTANVVGAPGSAALLVAFQAGSAPLPVVQTNQTSTGVTGGSPQLVQVGTGSTTVLRANTLREGGYIYNEGSVPIYLCYGPTANPTSSYSLQISAGDPAHVIKSGYTGIITATTGPNVNSTANVWTTEFVP